MFRELFLHPHMSCVCVCVSKQEVLTLLANSNPQGATESRWDGD